MRRRNDAADRAGRGWDALLAGRPAQPGDGAEFAETIVALHADDDAPPVDPAFANRLAARLNIGARHVGEEHSMNQPFVQGAGSAPIRPEAYARQNQDRRSFAKRGRGIQRWLTAAIMLALIAAIGGAAIDRDRFNHPAGETGINAAQIAAPASPTSAIKARLIMFVYACPAGYDMMNPSANPSVDCAAVATGVPFTLSGNGIVPMTHNVIAQGWVDYAPLEAGQYELTEAMPAGVTSAFIDGCSSKDRTYTNFPFKPIARIGPDGKLAINILDGDKFMCSWFNVPAMIPATPTP